MVSEIGKQARAVDESSRARNDGSPPKQHQSPKNTMAGRATEPVLSNVTAGQTHHATHHADAAQPAQHQPADTKAKNKRIPDENIAKLVAEENESKSKFPHYPGLERWQLVEKMGDGAFSNVYRARDREGNAGDVAIKVVRKFEMNSMQVRLANGDPCISIAIPFPCYSSPYSFSLPFQVPFTNSRAVLERQTSPSRL